MTNENLWYAFAGLFALAGAIHFLRALKKTGGRRNAGFALAGASLIWGATALTFRFAGLYPAGLVALAAVGCMLLAAVSSGKVR
jgi:hypothetical protein